MRLLYAIESDPGLDALRELAKSDGGSDSEEYVESDDGEGCPKWDRLLREARRGDTVYATLRAIVDAEGDIAPVLDGMSKRGVVLKVFDVDRDTLYTTRVLGPS